MTQGTLFLCATPIGNLGDISSRVIETMREADLIAAEDTRNSIRLLNHFGISTPMTSYHEYNKVEKAYALIEKMKFQLNFVQIQKTLRKSLRTNGDFGKDEFLQVIINQFQ